VSIVSSILDILASALGIARKRNDDANTEAMKRNKEARQDQAAADSAADAIARRDTEEVRRRLSGLCLAIVCSALVFSYSACTVAPRPVAAQQASFGVSGQQDSGFIAFCDGGAFIDRSAVARFNGLVAIYGSRFVPALRADDGIVEQSGGLYFISNASLQKFMLMADWRREGRK
jgi:hypothetical protein